jgi:hypothetical protein
MEQKVSLDGVVLGKDEFLDFLNDAFDVAKKESWHVQENGTHWRIWKDRQSIIVEPVLNGTLVGRVNILPQLYVRHSATTFSKDRRGRGYAEATDYIASLIQQANEIAQKDTDLWWESTKAVEALLKQSDLFGKLEIRLDKSTVNLLGGKEFHISIQEKDWTKGYLSLTEVFIAKIEKVVETTYQGKLKRVGFKLGNDGKYIELIYSIRPATAGKVN